MSPAFSEQTNIILGPYQQSTNFTLRYKRDESRNVLTSLVIREVGVILSYHLGLPKSVEVYARVPVLWKTRIGEDYLEYTESKDGTLGIGDLSLGAKCVFLREKRLVPDVIGTLEAILPTMSNFYILDDKDLGLGLGYWSIALGMTVIKSSDPVVIYGGLTYVYLFEKKYNRRTIYPGAVVVCNLGTAIAVNDKLVLGGQVIGLYYPKIKIDSKKVLFSSSEPIMFKISLAYALNKDIFFEPTLSCGLNEDADDVALTLSCNRRF